MLRSDIDAAASGAASSSSGGSAVLPIQALSHTDEMHRHVALSGVVGSC